jgi:hypothetical protein
VVISTDGDGRGDHDTSCVDCLEYALEMASSSDLFNKNWCKTFRAQFFVHTEVIDLDGTDISGDTSALTNVDERGHFTSCERGYA